MKRTLASKAVVALLAVTVWSAGHRHASAQADRTPPMARPPVRDPDHTFQKYVPSWKELREQGIVMQRRDFSCGAAALATVIRYYWGDDASETLFLVILDRMLTPEEAADRVKNGLTMTDLRRAAVEVGYEASLGTLSLRQLTEAKIPLVVGIRVDGHDHFAVYRGTDCEFIYLADPLRGRVRVPIWEFKEQWQKNMVLAVAKPGTPLPKCPPLSITCPEIRVGETNRQWVRRDALRPQIPAPRAIRP